jgi:soluble lytic murein transglycosylase-like protein
MGVTSKGGVWLVHRNGPAAGVCLPLERPVTCIGRAGDNDIAVDGEHAATVSAYHLEIRREGEAYHLYDRESTNGTYVNGRPVSDATLEPGCVIRLGPRGPEFVFEVRQPSGSVDADGAFPELPTKTVLGMAALSFPSAANTPKAPASRDGHEELVAEAVQQVRSARIRGMDQTAVIFRKMLRRGIHQSSRRSKQVIVGLVVTLFSVTAYSWWSIDDLQRQKIDIDAQIAEIESRLEAGGQDPQEIDQLIARLTQYQQRARSLQDSVFFQFTGEGRKRIFVRREIETLLAEFGAIEYNTPPEFVEEVQQGIERYQGGDRPHMDRALGRARAQFNRVRELVEQHHLPGDLAYIVLVESAFINGRTSQADATGLWQFRPETARQFGLVVNDEVDERLDVEKSTLAAARYIRSLILEFGSGSSVMLALAAYNSGPTRVRRAVRKISDPINQRNFWHLYRTGALPEETREYVPKIFAAIIIGRNPEEFGF